MNKVEIIKFAWKEYDYWDTTRYLSRFFTAWLRAKITFGLKSKFRFFLGQKCDLQFRKNITLGHDVRIGDFCILSGLGEHGLNIGSNSSIGSFSRVIVSSSLINPGKFITIGNNVGISEYASLGGSGGLMIGDDTIIGQYFSAHPENHEYKRDDLLIRMQGTQRAQINIGKNCWIGSKVTVLAGVNIGDGAVIGAGSVVTRDIPAASIAAGNPCVVIKQRVNTMNQEMVP